MSKNAESFLKMYQDVWSGHVLAPRGSEIHEVCDYTMHLDMGLTSGILTSFRRRALNLKYCKEEWLWYLRADRFDSSIETHAKMWQKLQQSDGGYNSNYGQYLFPKQFDYVVEELIKDLDSRRASMVLLRQEHLYHANTDVVCTYGINFRVRNAKLDMTVMMRSNDCIFGTTNDVFCFSMLYRMVYAYLRNWCPELGTGRYTHFVNSLHVYQRHYGMIQDLISDGVDGYTPIAVPCPTHEEVMKIISLQRFDGYHNEMVGPMTEWLTNG